MVEKSPWIPVANPPVLHDKEYMVDALFSDKILVADAAGGRYAGWAWRWTAESTVRWRMAGSNAEILSPMYWMPIPPLPEDE